jgi:2-polyprenyl-3-methyl-5-hydroxy-6-metoxy-1,4-benzoquinol methylase
MTQASQSQNQAGEEIARGERFAFGTNWQRFSTTLDDQKIDRAYQTLCEMLLVDNLQGKRFLDIGCSSGLFSLAAKRLGAEVHSFDFDAQSVACAIELKARYFANDKDWQIEQGSALDPAYLKNLGQWDIVYSWGILHHTGDMWGALLNVVPLVNGSGSLYIAIYNDDGAKSKRWTWIKKQYNQHKWAKPWLLTYGLLRTRGGQFLRDLIKLKPLYSWRAYKEERGMSPWYDVVDWIGGWPFEVATPEALFRFYKQHHFTLHNMLTRQGKGCNELVFKKQDDTS